MTASVSRISVIVRRTLIHFAKAISGSFHLRSLCQVLCPLILISVQSRPEIFCQVGIVKNFVKFKGKHLYQSLLLIKLQAVDLPL